MKVALNTIKQTITKGGYVTLWCYLVTKYAGSVTTSGPTLTSVVCQEKFDKYKLKAVQKKRLMICCDPKKLPLPQTILQLFQ